MAISNWEETRETKVQLALSMLKHYDEVPVVRQTAVWLPEK
jgi:hypothetical protein